LVTDSLLRLCAAVEEAGNLTLGTFAETNRPAAQPEQAIRQLMSKLDALNREFPKFESEVGGEFLALPKTSVSREQPVGNGKQ
jgi:hypothetical protein